MDAAIRAPQADTVQGPNDLAVLASSAVLVSATPEHRRSPCLCPSFSSSHSLASVSPSNFSLMPREPPPASLDFAALASDPSIFSVPRLSASCRPRCHWTAPLQVATLPLAPDLCSSRACFDTAAAAAFCCRRSPRQGLASGQNHLPSTPLAWIQPSPKPSAADDLHLPASHLVPRHLLVSLLHEQDDGRLIDPDAPVDREVDWATTMSRLQGPAPSSTLPSPWAARSAGLFH
ncbi:uncharacterized protein LOC125548313 isoform X2 [Triticum urartu]|uniref:uncharacterized protein LOC125548313 isoform X2 n=1 Tax=Triticum urartu TaxID=4572 RepID=UPI002042F3DD|nr:uncharacterized protein LOC125548313 isoform X2 [Triticum urartu]XP_048567916.1 uncharacterized protein LOC125548313 isoform X2 [Triticum urartu]